MIGQCVTLDRIGLIVIEMLPKVAAWITKSRTRELCLIGATPIRKLGLYVMWQAALGSISITIRPIGVRVTHLAIIFSTEAPSKDRSRLVRSAGGYSLS